MSYRKHLNNVVKPMLCRICEGGGDDLRVICSEDFWEFFWAKYQAESIFKGIVAWGATVVQ